MTEKLAWMPFYGADFYHDEAVRLMSREEEATYLRLLWHQWREGSLPALVEHVEKMADGPVSQQVLGRFPVTRDADGRRRNPRLDAIRQEQLAHIEARSRAGKAGRAKQMQDNAPPEPGQSPDNRRAKAKQSPGKTETESKNNTANWLTPFADAWQVRCGNPPMGRLAKILAPLRQSLGEPEAVARWSRYLTSTEPRYCSPERFVATHAAYAGPSTLEMTDDMGEMRLHTQRDGWWGYEKAGQWVRTVEVSKVVA